MIPVQHVYGTQAASPWPPRCMHVAKHSLEEGRCLEAEAPPGPTTTIASTSTSTVSSAWQPAAAAQLSCVAARPHLTDHLQAAGLLLGGAPRLLQVLQQQVVADRQVAVEPAAVDVAAGGHRAAGRRVQQLRNQACRAAAAAGIRSAGRTGVQRVTLTSSAGGTAQPGSNT